MKIRIEWVIEKDKIRDWNKKRIKGDTREWVRQKRDIETERKGGKEWMQASEWDRKREVVNERRREKEWMKEDEWEKSRDWETRSKRAKRVSEIEREK